MTARLPFAQTSKQKVKRRVESAIIRRVFSKCDSPVRAGQRVRRQNQAAARAARRSAQML